MARNRFVAPDTKQLNLSDGDWLEVKTQIDWGESLLLTGGTLGLLRTASGDYTNVSVDWKRNRIERVMTWVVDWSFKDADGQPVPFGREAVEHLNPATGVEIERALDEHIKALDDQKKVPSPSSESASPSP